MTAPFAEEPQAYGEPVTPPGSPAPETRPLRGQPASSDFGSRVDAYPAGTGPRQFAPPGRYQPVVPDRPGTVTAAAVILFVSAGFGVLLCAGVGWVASQESLSDEDQTVLAIFALALIADSILNVVLGYFILQGRQWARITAIVFAVLASGFGGINLLLGLEQQGPGALSNCLGIILNIVVIGLLSGSQASDYFRSMR